MPKFEFKKNMIIGMVHLLPLINTTHYKDNNEEIINRAIEDAKTLEGANVDAIMVENMGDSPLRETLKHEQAIMLAVILHQKLCSRFIDMSYIFRSNWPNIFNR